MKKEALTTQWTKVLLRDLSHIRYF